MERSSCGVLEEANIDRKTAGVTGMRLEESDDWELFCAGWAVSFEEVVEETERGMIVAHNVTVMKACGLEDTSTDVADFCLFSTKILFCFEFIACI